MKSWLKKSYMFISAILSCYLIQSQTNETDSLISLLKDVREDTLLIDAYTRLSVIYYENNPEQSVQYGMLALGKAEKQNDPVRLARVCQSIGVAYDYKGNLDSCLFFLNRAAKICRESGFIDKESHILSDIALAHYLRGNYEFALRNHLEALRLRKEFGDKRFIAISYNNIGLVYRSRKDFENAIRYYKLSFSLKQENNDEKGILNTYINIGSAYQNNNQFDSALAYAQKANELAKILQLENDILAAQSNMAAALVNLKRIEEAIPLLSTAEIKAIAAGEKKSLLTIYETYGDALKLKGNLPDAEKMYKKGLNIASQNKRREYMEVFYRKLANLNHAAGNYRAAFDFAEKSIRIKDSLWNEENSRQINEMSAVYETAEKEKEIGSLYIEKKLDQAELQQRKRERNYFVLSSFLFLGIAGVSYIGYKSNKKKKNILNKQNLVIEQQLAEKEYLLKEIHHRVKNNLQVISSLLSLQSKYIKDEQALDAVKDSRNRVHSMAMIHQNLYREDNLTGIDLRDYITRLCQNLFQSYNIHDSRIRLFTDIDALIMDVDLVVPLGLILNELITNSLKYAFPNNREGEIHIALWQKNNQILLNVKDDGIGFPESTLTEKKDSLGSKLIHAFVQKLKGEMKAYNNSGAVVEINFIHTGIHKR